MKNVKLMAKSIDINYLDQVSGGGTDECRQDMNLFFGGGIQTFSSGWKAGYGPLEIDAADLKKLEAAFAQYGITAKLRLNKRTGPGSQLYNHYYMGNQRITRVDAWTHIFNMDPGRFQKVFENSGAYPFTVL